MGMDKKYLMCALAYAVLGMSLGVYMGASQDHGQLVTHAHTLLVGFVVSLIYAVIHKLWLNGSMPRLATVQFFVHQIGAVMMIIGLFLLYGHVLAEEQIGPVLGISSVIVLAGMVLMLALVFKSGAVSRPA
jgi:hypothetical protein